MKRYILGLLAVVIAVSSVAFKAPAKKTATKLFAYSGANYQEANVENPANWTYIGSANPNCSVSNIKACEIEVNDALVNPDNTLPSSFSIIATASSTNVFYVTGGAMTNKRNRN